MAGACALRGNMVLYSRVLSTDGKRCVPPWRGALLWALRSIQKGGLTMVTYSDLIQIGILVVAILSLIVQINQAKK